MNRLVVLLILMVGLLVGTIVFYIVINSKPSGPELSGSVTLDDQPVQSGSIVFSPDLGQNNDGGRAQGLIENGKFRLIDGEVFTPGDNIVTVTLYEYGGYSLTTKAALPTSGANDLKVSVLTPEGVNLDDFKK